MYTLVLMTSLSAAPDGVEFHGFFRRLFSFGGHSCCGGSGSEYGSCTGGSRLRAYSSCCGGGYARGYGSCTGSSLSACSGSGYQPCSGGGVSFSCTGGMMNAPTGIDPGFAVPSAGTQFYYPTFYGPSEAAGCFGSGMGGGPGIQTIPPVPGLAPPMPAVPGEISDSPGGRNASFASGTAGRATVVVKVPADAVLYAEGRRLSLTGTDRSFTTPPLPAGDWGYTFRAEYIRDGETISRTKRVGVKPGEAVALEFTEAGLARTTKLATPTVPTVVPPPLPGGTQPATLTIKLPPGGTLTVDGKQVKQSGDFRTPPLAPGREYSYQMQADLMKDGKPVRESTKVSFRAGELVTVDFTALPK